jgi:D-3-phosphoglycerate dehydrogenase
MKKIFISAPYLHRDRNWVEKNILDHLERKYEVIWIPVEERLSERELMSFIHEPYGIICGDDAFSEKVIRAAKNLKVIVKWGTGVDSIDVRAAEFNGIEIKRTPGAFTTPVAETTLGFILNHYRGISKNNEIFVGGGWDKPSGDTLSKKVVGIVGFGDIGRRVAELLSAFGAIILVNDTREIPRDELLQGKYRTATLPEILQSADIISLHCDLNETSRLLLNKAAFSLMQRQPFLVNTARGGLVDYDALLNALSEGRVSGCGLDVFDEEPVPVSSPLRGHPAVTASCHNSNSSLRHWRKIHSNSFAMLLSALEGDQ